jgi:polysaccharide deacetylase 2 family uncharacterized protein YibQ
MTEGNARSGDQRPSQAGRLIVMSMAGLLLLLAIGIAAWALLARGPGMAETGSASIAVGHQPDGGSGGPSPAVDQSSVQLGPVPDPALIADSPYGALPVTGADGSKPWQVYARPFPNPGTAPRIAILFTDIGINADRSRDALSSLPPEVSLAISAYAQGGQDWVRAARAAGHEVFLAVPMEPVNYPQDDPGPLTLLTSASPDETLDKLSRMMAGISGYVGIVNTMGSRFTAARASLQPVMETLSYRGLMFLDAATSQYSLGANMAAEGDVPHAFVNRRLDDMPSREAILSQLKQLEQVAQAYGAAVGLARPYPVSVQAVNEWAAGLASRNLTLAPVTATANRQPLSNR